MPKKIGILLGLFFFGVSVIRFFNEETRLLSLFLMMFGVGYIIFAGKAKWQMLGQLLLGTICGCYLVYINDPHNTAPMIIFSTTLLMRMKYFPNNKEKTFLWSIPYFVTAIIAEWTIFNIIPMLLAYTAYTSLIFVLNNDKV